LNSDNRGERDRESEKKFNFFLLFVREGVNFINVLHVHFLNESALLSFSLVMFWLWQKYKSTFVKKSTSKMLMKLSQGERVRKRGGTVDSLSLTCRRCCCLITIFLEGKNVTQSERESSLLAKSSC